MKKIFKSNPINHYVYLPERIDEKMPIIIYLHGIGERGKSIELVEKYGLPKYLSNNTLNLPYIIIVPQCEEKNFWDYHLRDVEKIICKTIEKYNGDKERIALLGTSMGAFGAWNYIMQRSDLFKCLISVSGGAMLPVNQNISNIKNKSFLIYHGDKDDIIKIEKSKEIYDVLVAQNANDVEFKIIKDDNHYLSSHAFKDKYMYEWLKERL